MAWRTCEAAGDPCPAALEATAVCAEDARTVSLRGRDWEVGPAEGAPEDLEEDERLEVFRGGAMVRWRTFVGRTTAVFMCPEDNGPQTRYKFGCLPLVLLRAIDVRSHQ